MPVSADLVWWCPHDRAPHDGRLVEASARCTARAPWSRPGLSHQPLPAAERQTTVNIPVLAARAASITRKAATAAFMRSILTLSEATNNISLMIRKRSFREIESRSSSFLWVMH